MSTNASVAPLPLAFAAERQYRSMNSDQETTVNCFVIMPFAGDFDDVYAVVKQTVEGVIAGSDGKCFRLDESRPAGRITERLLRELRAASLCIADLTGNKPNVMWELGFAMALGKPVVVTTQRLGDLPFDIKDLQGIEYDRSRLTATLAQPLRRMLLDTIAVHRDHESPKNNVELVGSLLQEVSQLKSIVVEAVATWKTEEDVADRPVRALKQLEGHWVNAESKSHLYAQVIDDDLVAPYCFGGNHNLTGSYFGWRRTGDYWFARFKWLGKSDDIAGFAFMRQQSSRLLSGAWWSIEANERPPNSPPEYRGVAAEWRRVDDDEPPPWALAFFEEVRREGIASRVAG